MAMLAALVEMLGWGYRVWGLLLLVGLVGLGQLEGMRAPGHDGHWGFPVLGKRLSAGGAASPLPKRQRGAWENRETKII